MNYLEFRRLLGADPNHPDPELQRLKREDPRCARDFDRAQELERKIERALEVPVPEGLADRILLAQSTNERKHGRRRRQRWFMGLAASMVLGIGMAGGLLWSDRSLASLERHVVNHIRHEPQALMRIEGVPFERVREALAEFGLDLRAPIGSVTFVKRCPTPNGEGLHLVVRTAEGPVTVLYMPDTAAGAEGHRFARDGLDGMLFQAGGSSVAVVGGDGAGLERVKRELEASLTRRQS